MDERFLDRSSTSNKAGSALSELLDVESQVAATGKWNILDETATRYQLVNRHNEEKQRAPTSYTDQQYPNMITSQIKDITQFVKP